MKPTSRLLAGLVAGISLLAVRLPAQDVFLPPPPPLVTVHLLADDLPEGAGPTPVFRVERDQPTDLPLRVEFELHGSAEPGADYRAIPDARVVEFAPGALGVDILVDPLPDAIQEGRESLEIRLLPPVIPAVVGAIPPYVLGEPSEAESHLVDGPKPEAASLRITAPAAGAVLAPGVPETLKSIAVDPAGYIPRVEFRVDGAVVGVSEVAFLVEPEPGTPVWHDVVWEVPEPGPHRIVAIGTSSTGARIEAPAVEVTVSGIPVLPEVRVSAVNTVAVEGGESFFSFRVTRTGDLTRPQPVGFILDGTAERGVDFDLEYDPCGLCEKVSVPVTGNEVMIPEGVTSVVIGGSARADDLAEGEESVVLRLVERDAADGFPYVVGEPAVARAWLRDAGAEPVPVVTIVTVEDSAREDEPWDIAIFEIRRTGDWSKPLTVFVGTGGEAVRPDDYVLIPEGNFEWCPACARPELPPIGSEVVIPAGQGHVRIGARAVLDDLVEGEESLVVEIIMPPACPDCLMPYTVGALAQARAVIKDARLWASVSIRTTDERAAEADPEDIAVFELRRTGPDDEPLTVFIRTLGDAQRPLDYELIPEGEFGWCPECDRVPLPPIGGEVTFPAGEDRIRIGARAVADDVVEGNEGFAVEIVMPPVCPGCPLPYQVEGTGVARAVIVDSTAPPRKYVLLRQPLAGAVFRAPADILLEAETRAGDDDAFLNVEFFANGVRVAVSDLNCPVCDLAIVPGGVVRHVARWVGAEAGEYELVAVGRSMAGIELKSPAVRIRVQPAGDRPVVSVVASQAETTEPGPNVRVIPGRFTFRREAGDVARPLRVRYRVGGTALNGIDYAKLDGDFTFESGQVERDLLVAALADGLVEPRESVVVALRESDDYRMGDPSSATVWIGDAPGGTMGEVVITAPATGDVLPPGEPAVIRALAMDPEGHVPAVEFFVDGRSLGLSQVVFIREPDPGTPIEHEIVWPAPVAGEHRLVAVGHSADGKRIESRAVEVVVAGDGPAGFVIRRLPANYVPGEPVAVVLVTQPGDGTQAHAVEDEPPAGWQVGEISHDGVFDPATGRVKFGPFLDSESRELRYRLMPPADAGGRGLFTGVASADGVDSRIGGDQVLAPVRRHPADLEPADDRIVVGEVTGYAAAWREGEEWPAGPNPIPVSHVTRAAYLWKQGEAYLFDPGAGPAPLWWVPVPRVAAVAGGDDDGPGHDLVDDSGGDAGDDQAPRFLPPGGFGLVRWSGGGGDAGTRNVEVQVLPVPGTRAQAVEIRIGSGAAVADVSDGGRYDAATGWLRWGPYLDDQPRRLSAVVSGSEGRPVLGVVSCDGQDRPVIAWSDDDDANPGTGPRIEHVNSRRDGSIELVIRDDDGSRSCDLEVSSDLREWRPVRELPSGATWSVETDTDASDSEIRFYRVRRR